MSKKLQLVLVLLFSIQGVFGQYCFPTFSIGCTSNDFINNVFTTGGVSNINNLNTGCTGTTPSVYTFYNTQVVSQIQGFGFNISMQAGTAFSQGFRVWIDWNQDLDFADPGEDVYVSPGSATTPFVGTINVPITATPGQTRMRILCRYVTVPAITDYCGTGFSFGECEDYVMDVIPATPCSGTPNAGNAFPVTQTLCAGQVANLSLQGATLQGNLTYQWQQSTNGGATWVNVIGGIGATSPGYQTASLTTTIMYRMIMNCTNSGLADTSNPCTINVTGPTYASLPYNESFESWTNYCNVQDVPTYNWSNNPATGNDSWRRFDEGSSAAWTAPTAGAYFPAASHNSYSARFHSSYTALSGNLDVYIDCSSSIGNKTLSFDYINDNITFGGFDFLEVLYSTNGGATFVPLSTFNNAQTWTNNMVIVPSNSATTVIRFRATGDNMNSDIGIDNMMVLPPCAGTPNAGAITQMMVCPNTNFNLTLSGNTLQGGLIYYWESAPTATGPWTPVGLPTAAPTTTTQIPVATYFRCIVECQATALTDTTAPELIDLNSFYYCYCISQANPPTFTFQNIGNVSLINTSNNAILLNNGNPLPLLGNFSPINLYSQFAFTVPPIEIYRDSTYSGLVTSFAQNTWYNNGFAAIYIDYDRDGVFNPITELAAAGFSNSPSQIMASNFTVPSTASYGITGMRVVYEVAGSATTINPCGNYSNGETEDYLVNIALPPCHTPPNAGIAHISDTITCPGYTVFLIDTTHDLNFQNLTFNWQYSVDGVNFTDVPLATADTMSFTVNSNTWFRFRTTCNGTSTGYSNVVKVVMSPPFACYGNSQAIGGILDSSDVGAVIISDMSNNNNIYSFISGGPHLNNPNAIRRRTDYTSFGAMDLSTDSTYKLSIYHIMKSLTHADAKITVFIDYNNNQAYDVPNERVFTGIANVNNFYLVGSFTTPVNPALNVPTGMRVVLNNDLGASAASDNGVGTYVSGETEDYLVKFRLKQLFPTSLEEVSQLDNVGVYPNPANSKVYIGFDAKENMDVTISIISMTCSLVDTRVVSNIYGAHVSEFNVGSLAKGAYMIKISTSNGANLMRKLIVE